MFLVTFGDLPLRIVKEDDGSLHFVAMDVGTILGLGNTSRMLERVPAHQKGMNVIHTPGGPQSMLTLTEAGLYRVTMRSDKPQAQPFINFVCDEVLPSIRKDGFYVDKRAAAQPFAELADTFGVDEFRALGQQIHDDATQIHESMMRFERALYRVGDDVRDAVNDSAYYLQREYGPTEPANEPQPQADEVRYRKSSHDVFEDSWDLVPWNVTIPTPRPSAPRGYRLVPSWKYRGRKRDIASRNHSLFPFE